MAKLIIGLTMSLDGFINDRTGSVAALYPDHADLPHTTPMRESIRATGAVVMGWRTYAMATDPDSYEGSYEYQVPIFVLTHTIPQRLPKTSGTLSFTFVTEGLERAVAQAKVAAADRDVTVVGGAKTLRRCIESGLADELHIDIMPVLLGGGLRLFDYLEAAPVALERSAFAALPSGRTHLAFRIVT